MTNKQLAETLELHRLHVRCVIPAFAREEWQHGTYAAWYIGHHVDAMLSDEHLAEHYRRWMKDVDQSDGGDMESFMAWLGDYSRADWEGYIALHSGPEGYCMLEAEPL